MGSSARAVRRASMRSMNTRAKMPPNTVLARYMIAGPAVMRTALKVCVVSRCARTIDALTAKGGQAGKWGFVLLVVAGVYTVALPELENDPERAPDAELPFRGSYAVHLCARPRRSHEARVFQQRVRARQSVDERRCRHRAEALVVAHVDVGQQALGDPLLDAGAAENRSFFAVVAVQVFRSALNGF